MSGRLIVSALCISMVVVLVGAFVAPVAVVVAGLLAALFFGLLLVIKTDDTTQPMREVLFAEDANA